MFDPYDMYQTRSRLRSSPAGARSGSSRETSRAITCRSLGRERGVARSHPLDDRAPRLVFEEEFTDASRDPDVPALADAG
jgi:hypothetical protein